MWDMKPAPLCGGILLIKIIADCTRDHWSLRRLGWELGAFTPRLFVL